MRNPFIRYIINNHPLTAAIVIGVALLIIQIRTILVDVFVAYTIMAALSPFVIELKKRKIPNFFAALITYICALALFTLLIFPLIPFFVSQILSLFKSFPVYLNYTANLIGIKVTTQQIQALAGSELGAIGENAYAVTKSIFSGFFSILSILVISFYLLLDRENVKKSFVKLFPTSATEYVERTVSDIEDKLGAWVRGQIVLSFFIGSITWIALTALGIPFALPLALIAGILEIVPTLGPILSAIPAMIVALSINPALTIVVAASYTGIQMLENNLLVPKIMQHAVGLNPVIIIVAVSIGATLMGVLGALLAIPFLSVLILLVKALKHSSNSP